MRWHHYLGLIFGFHHDDVRVQRHAVDGSVGLASGYAPTRDQRERLAGGAIDRRRSVRPRPSGARSRHTRRACPRRSRSFDFAAITTRARLRASCRSTRRNSAPPISCRRIWSWARPTLVMPGVPIDGVQLDGRLRRLLLRSRSARVVTGPARALRRSAATWLYFDPRHGTIARKEERLTRLNRWLYHGFHSFDFPFLYYRRPLWDIVVIVLSIGGRCAVDLDDHGVVAAPQAPRQADHRGPGRILNG